MGPMVAMARRSPSGLRTAHKRGGITGLRSEEHTSELQSQSNLVCRLLLEKKKTPEPPRPAHLPSEDRPHVPPSPLLRPLSCPQLRTTAITAREIPDTRERAAHTFTC